MPSRISSCVIGIDVGGTNTDAVILQDENILAWHKTPTTPDIQDGVEQAITAVIKSAQIPKDSIDFIKIGTTLASPDSLRGLMEGHYGYVDGGLQGFLERENASILNASLRRFARHVIAGFARCYMTLECEPLYYVKRRNFNTTTDICALLKSGYPRQSAAFVKIAGVRTNFTIPDVYSIALGEEDHSYVLRSQGKTTVGPDSVGPRLKNESIAFGGQTLTFANAVGAAIGKISGHVDTVVTPGEKTIEEEIEEAKLLAIQRCVAAGGDEKTIEVVEVDTLPINYVTNGSTQLVVRVVGDLLNTGEKVKDLNTIPRSISTFKPKRADSGYSASGLDSAVESKASTYDILEHIDVESYRPRLEGDIWHLSEIDLKFLMDGTGVLANGEGLRIRRQDTIPDDTLIVPAGFMGSPTVYLERIPGLNEITDTVKALMSATGNSSFDATIPNEIGGMNSFEALLAAHRFGKPTIDSDCVARAYPMVWQTVRCLNGVSVTPAAVAMDAEGQKYSWPQMMRKKQNSSCAMHAQIKAHYPECYSWAWQIGRSIAIARSKKVDPVNALIRSQNGTLLYTGKVMSVTRKVAEGFTRGSVLLDHIVGPTPNTTIHDKSTSSLYVEFENENLCAILKTPGKDDVVLAVCPDLIVFLDIANGAPLGISDYKIGTKS
ncbi:hypothetical protein DID88_007477 [Monilinia fructigena]|uniref:Uncharacterized protein n=1 Tax=Monilinia fructigena TaxID=38457 RepID=A0A395J972_9HELO|nr:hypothetical protein DID88_007477 [Monilinia fructigena]